MDRQVTSPQMESDEKRLEALVDTGRFEEAAELCRLRLADAQHANRWLRELGFVCFLNDTNDTAYYEDAPRIFRELAQRSEESADAHFWLGYVRAIVESHRAAADESLTRALRLEPMHAYAHLVRAGLNQDSGAIHDLRLALDVQPGNLRAWRSLAQTLAQVGDRDGSRRSLERLVNAEPYIETQYGIMNTYMNEVLTGSAHAENWKQEARLQLK